MNMEDKEFMKKYILNNPFEFKQGIISHCREMDKIDVYNWVAEDELKIDKLQQENKQLKDNWNKLKEYCQDNSFMQNTREYGTLTVVDADELAIYMEELESGDSNE